MEMRFTDAVQSAIVCMYDRILNARREEDRPAWQGFSGRWFNKIHATAEEIVGNDGIMEVVQRTVTFFHNKTAVARVTLEGVYFLNEDNDRHHHVTRWDVDSIEYALRYEVWAGTSDWKTRPYITHNGATAHAKSLKKEE